MDRNLRDCQLEIDLSDSRSADLMARPEALHQEAITDNWCGERHIQAFSYTPATLPNSVFRMALSCKLIGEHGES